MSPQTIAIFCLAIVQYSLCYDTINEGKDPIQRFLKLDADSEHELVEIEFTGRLHKRALPAGTRMRIRAFGKNINLWLHPKSSVLVSKDTPVYYSRHAPRRPGNVIIERQPGLMMALGEIFEDYKYMASLVIGTDEYGKRTVNGQIGTKNLVVRSLPKNVINEYVRKRRSIDDLGDDKFSNLKYHVIYKAKEDYEKKYPLGAFNGTMLREKFLRSANRIPNIIYPKILLVADYSMYKEQGSYIYSFLEYLLAFSNGIDLKYRALENPKVRLHISGIIIGVDSKAIPYISDSMLSHDAFNASQAMLDARKFFYKIKDSIPLASYNTALTMTRLAFGLKDAAGVLGMGYVGTTCINLDPLYEEIDPIAMARDNGAFSGILVAAHELGHVFGSLHDMGGVSDCSYINGFIMAFTPRHTSNSSSFSTCSLKKFQQQLDDGNYKCMYKKPGPWHMNLPKLMPGRVVGIEKQCASFGRGPPCNISSTNICVNIHCLDSYNECSETSRAALEGTRCSDEHEKLDRYCVYNRCVHV